MPDLTHIFPWLAGGGLMLSGFLPQVRGLLARIRSILIISVTLDGEVAEAFREWCWRECRAIGWGDKRYGSRSMFVKPLNRWRIVGFENLGTRARILLCGWRPFLVAACSRVENQPGPVDVSTRITYMRGTLEVERLLIALLNERETEKRGDKANSRYRVEHMIGNAGRRGVSGESRGGELPTARMEERIEGVRPLGWKQSDLGQSRNGTSGNLDRLALPQRAEAAISEITRWFNSEQWYKDKGIAWRRGLMLWGKAGTGKTSMTRAIAKELGIPLFVFDLATMDNQDLVSCWRRMLSNAPCVALVEDIHAVFNGRSRVNERIELTFDCLLNCISGIEEANGVLVVVTTNDIGAIAPELGIADDEGRSTRPGRIDAVIELGVLSEAGRLKVGSRILSDCPGKIVQAVRDGDSETGAQFEERCRQIALEEFWKTGGNHVRQDTHGIVLRSGNSRIAV